MKKLILLIVALVVFFSASFCLAAIPAPKLCYTTNGLNVTASWSTVSGATGYTLYYAPFPYAGPDTIGFVDMAGATTLSVPLWEGAAFYIVVTAYDALALGEFSNVELFKTTAASTSASACCCCCVSSVVSPVKPCTICWLMLLIERART